MLVCLFACLHARLLVSLLACTSIPCKSVPLGLTSLTQPVSLHASPFVTLFHEISVLVSRHIDEFSQRNLSAITAYCLHVSLCVGLSVCLCMCVCLFVCLFVFALPVCKSCLTISRSVCAYLSVCLSEAATIRAGYLLCCCTLLGSCKGYADLDPKFSHAAGLGCSVGSPDRVFHLAQSRVCGPHPSLCLQAQASGMAMY